MHDGRVVAGDLHGWFRCPCPSAAVTSARMSQKLAYFLVDHERIAEVVAALTREGFSAQSAKRMVLGVYARVREGTDDESRATEVVERIVGSAVRRGPGGSPTTHLEGYRDGL